VNEISTIMRVLHLVSAVALAVLIYPGWGDDDSTLTLLRIVVIPALTITGAFLWVGRVRATSHR
jgi:hypothetical protein